MCTWSATPQAMRPATPVSPGGVATDLPLNGAGRLGTASSAEIVSGALQDAGRGQLAGEKTYGTGTVLGEFPLADGSALRVGTVEWLTPKGRRIWHDGIIPDVVVARSADIAPLGPDAIRSMTRAQLADLKDPQLLRALADPQPRPRRLPAQRNGQERRCRWPSRRPAGGPA